MPGKKMNVRDHLQDNALDLSMADLEEVPVRDIALIKKATSLDLSSNRLTILKNNFATLTHVTTLNLSKNLLTALPENFGELVHLRSLDLYHNKLTHLPLSLGQLKALRWLDLKDNPLVPVLADVAGPCLDKAQCQQCAKQIVLFLQEMNEKVEIRKQEIMEKSRKEQEAVQKKEEAKKKQKLSKADKKKANGVKSAPFIAAANANDKTISKKSHVNIKANSHHEAQPVAPKKKEVKKSAGSSIFGKLYTFLKFLLTLSAVCTVSMIVLHVVDREKYEALCQVTSVAWDEVVARLPAQVVEPGRRVADAARPALRLVWAQLLETGNTTAARVREGYSWLKNNEQSHHLVVQAESLWGVVCDRAGEFYRTVYELTLITVESVKKKVF